MLIFVHHDREIGATILTPAAAGARLKAGGDGVAVLSRGEDLARTECDADAALLAPPFVDVDPVQTGTV